MLNKVMLIGRVGKQPQIRFASDGRCVANFSLATFEKWRDKSGKKQEKTEWHNVVFFGSSAEVCQKWVNKGDLIHIEGSIRTDSYEDKDGITRYSTKIHGDKLKMLASGEGKENSRIQRSENESRNDGNQRPNFDDMDDDIPF